MSCSFLTSWLYSLSYFSYGTIIYGTFCVNSFNYPSCGDVICGTSIIYLAACTPISITHTIVGTINGSTLPLIIFCALTFVLSFSYFIPVPKAFLSSTLFFFLRAFFGKSATTFFLFSNNVFFSTPFLSASPP